MKRRKFLIGILLVLAVLYAAYNYLYQDHRDIQTEKPAFTLKATELVADFERNSESASKLYLDQTVEIVGKMKSLNSNSLTLIKGVFCQFTQLNYDHIPKDSIVTIKGRVIGYDDLLEEVRMDQCILTETTKQN